MAILEVKNIHKKFGRTEVLKGISFSMEKGRALSIIGSSGSGKTTLLRCLNFLETPEEGEILVDGKLLLDASDKKSRSDAQIRENRLHFGLVFQSFNLFPQYSVLRNITLARELIESKKQNGISKPEIEEEARAILDRVGLANRADAYPCMLSGGQQQRVAIARALALHPDILCFDEPTSALDPELTGEVLKVIKELKDANTTMIIVTHEMNFAKNVSDNVIFMANGIIEEYGTPEQVFEHPASKKTQSFLQKSLENLT